MTTPHTLPQGETPLGLEIRNLIRHEGPLPISRYMALCLGHPRHGYYLTRDPLGAAGDFTTAPEISQMFGELLGLWAAALWQQMGSPPVFQLIELGPGRGTLMADALRAARLLPAFSQAAQVHLVETSPVLRQAQQRALENSGVSTFWHDRIEDVPEGPAIVLANEFFDALPIDQYLYTKGYWHERRVGLDDEGRLIFGLEAAPSPLASHYAAHLPPPHEGAILERLDLSAARALARRLASQGGAALIIDYGHGGGYGDTLQALEHHHYADPLAHPGEADLTAHVDFAALAKTAKGEGLLAHGLPGQGDFLMRLGLAQRAQGLMQGKDEATQNAILAAVSRLCGSGPDEMGVLFKVLALGHPDLGALPAFDTTERMKD
ncbi:class I SAM-dependent methyltransferase [Xanthobacter sp. TB0139]|uniref:class I SAM-dependent methyltransferase n=1 Tax=Xanthobacter sp. TB0139 TaxID=3459178 RepID=UPI004039D330